MRNNERVAHLVSAAEEERRRIAGEIHDDSIQAMTAAGMRLQILRRALEDPEQLALLADLEEAVQLSISRLRHLLFELRPPVLDDEGLTAALRMYLDEAEAADGTKTSYRLASGLGSEPSREARVILYRIAQEALTNVRKHAGAANVSVTLEEMDGGYLVRVADDGVGFSADALTVAPGHLGLVAMRERAILAGGRLSVESAPGEGASLEAWIPGRPASESRAA